MQWNAQPMITGYNIVGGIYTHTTVDDGRDREGNNMLVKVLQLSV